MKIGKNKNVTDTENVVHQPLYNQNGSASPAKHRPDDSTVAQCAETIHEYFYRKMRRHVMIFQ